MLTSTAKNADSVTSAERVPPRPSLLVRVLHLILRRRFALHGWALAVLALCLLAYNDVRWRDQIVEEREQHQAELRAKDRELALYKPAGPKVSCREYVVHMEGMRLTFCRKQTITHL